MVVFSKEVKNSLANSEFRTSIPTKTKTNLLPRVRFHLVPRSLAASAATAAVAAAAAAAAVAAAVPFGT